MADKKATPTSPAAKPVREVAKDKPAPPPPAVQAPAVRRAGGHIDRGDGRGWVIEE